MPSLLLYLYALLGPLLWLLLALGLVTARVRMAKLKHSKARLPAAPPKVAVLVPAHNEGASIAACLESLLKLDYPDYTLIATDDRSTDQTLSEMRRVAREHAARSEGAGAAGHSATSGPVGAEGTAAPAKASRPVPSLEVIHIDAKPSDWLGKCHALHVASGHPLAREAEWLLFVDSDVTVTPDSLRLTLAQGLSRGVDAVSILTRQRCDSFLEKLLTPLACATVLAMYVASHTNDDNRTSNAFANGQFFLIRRTAYDRAGGHETVKNLPTEDVDLMRALKRTGAKCRLYAGDHLAETRMYDSLKRMFSGWARIYSGASHRRPWRILLATPFILSGLAAFVAPFLLAGAGPAWAALATAHVVVTLLCLAAVYAWSGNSPLLAFLFPLAAPFQLAFFAKALLWSLTNKMEWRGTAYSAPPAPPATGA